MNTYSLTNKPQGPAFSLKKKTFIRAVFLREPFSVETQEGTLLISPETCKDWDEGYWLAYPSDGSEPYAISPGYMSDNYITDTKYPSEPNRKE